MPFNWFENITENVTVQWTDFSITVDKDTDKTLSSIDLTLSVNSTATSNYYFDDITLKSGIDVDVEDITYITRDDHTDVLPASIQHENLAEPYLHEPKAHMHPLSEIEDVDLTGLTDDDILQYNDATGNFEATALSGAIDHNGLNNLQGGTTNEYYHLTSTEYTDYVTNFSESIDDRVSSLIQNGTGIAWTYDDVANTLTGNVSITQYTDALARQAISETVTGLDYDNNTGVLSLTTNYVIPTTTEESNWNTAYGWGNHAGLYDAVGTASGLIGTHESTYNHANYNTAYGWGNHASAGYLKADGTVDLSADWTIASKNITLTGGTISAKLGSITNADATDAQLSIINSNTGATAAGISFKKLSASPAVDDEIMYLRSTAYNSTPAEKTYAAILTKAIDITPSGEKGAIWFNTISGGTIANRAAFYGENFGLKTATASKLLHLNVADASNDRIRFGSALTTGITGIEFYDGATFNGIIGLNYGTDAFNVYTRGDASNPVFYLTSGGYCGIGKNIPQTYCHVWGGNAGTDPAWTVGSNVFIVESASNALVTCFSPATAYGGIECSDPGGVLRGAYLYNHATDAGEVYTNGALAMTITSAGCVGILKVPAAGIELDVNGNIEADSYADHCRVYDLSDAVNKLKNIKAKAGTSVNGWSEVDHTTLPDGVRNERIETFYTDKDGEKLLYHEIKQKHVDKENCEEYIASLTKSDIIKYSRNLSNYIPMLHKAILELEARIKILEGKL